MLTRWSIFLFIFSIPIASQAIELNAYRCSKYLITLAPLHQLPSMSAQFTEAAMSDLLRFRTNNLIDSPFQASNKAVTASDESSQRRKAKVAARVSGVLHDYRSPPQNTANDGEDRKSILVATSFVGKENILNELRKRQALVEEWKADPEIKQILDYDKLVIFGIFPTITLGLPTQYYLEQGHTSLPYILVFCLMAREFYEITARGVFNLYNLSHQTSEEYLDSELERINTSGLWHYSSFDMEVSKNYLDRVWGPDSSLDAAKLKSFNYMTAYPKFTMQSPVMKQYTVLRLIEHLDPPKANQLLLSNFTWLRVDEVLHFDPVKKEPVLTIVLRMTKKLPRYPKRSPQKSKALTKLVPVLKPTD